MCLKRNEKSNLIVKKNYRSAGEEKILLKINGPNGTYHSTATNNVFGMPVNIFYDRFIWQNFYENINFYACAKTLRNRLAIEWTGSRGIFGILEMYEEKLAHNTLRYRSVISRRSDDLFSHKFVFRFRKILRAGPVWTIKRR